MSRAPSEVPFSLLPWWCLPCGASTAQQCVANPHHFTSSAFADLQGSSPHGRSLHVGLGWRYGIATPMVAAMTIVAMGGGGFMADRESPLDDFMLSLRSREATARLLRPDTGGDRIAGSPRSSSRSLRELRAELPSPVRDARASGRAPRTQDAVYVSGGNTANALAIWRVHGFDRRCARPGSAGVLGGWSAGVICWFEAVSPTRSGRSSRACATASRFLPGSACPHYDGEERRRPVYTRARRRTASPRATRRTTGPRSTSWARSCSEVVASYEGARGYRVEPGSETPIADAASVKKVAVVTSASGSGGTTVGRGLAERLDVPFHELDALFWKPGWIESTAEELRASRRADRRDGRVGDRRLATRARSASSSSEARTSSCGSTCRCASGSRGSCGARSGVRRSGEELWDGNRESLRKAFLQPRLADPVHASALPRRAATYPMRCAGFRLVRLRSQARDRRLPQAASRPRPELGDPRRHPEPEPDRRQEHVEDEVAEQHEEPPQREPASRDPALLAHVARSSRRRPERVAQRRLARSAVRARIAWLVAHAFAAARRRRSTSRMIRIAVSSTDSSVTSITGQRSRLCSFVASSSSS